MVKANRKLRPPLQGRGGSTGAAGRQTPQEQLRSPTLRAFLSAHVGTLWKSVLDEYQGKFPAERGRERPDIWAGLVATGTSLKQGRVRVHVPRVGVLPLEAANIEFFVHPELGTLLRNEHYVPRELKERERIARRREELHARMREVSARAQAHKIGQIWHLVELGHHPFAAREHGTQGAGGGEEAPQMVFDVVLGRMVDASDRFDLERIYGRRGVYGVRRRELSYRELRELGLLSTAKV